MTPPLCALVLALAQAAAPAPPPAAALQKLPPPPAAASGASGTLDPLAAARAYLDELPPAQRLRSNAYFIIRTEQEADLYGVNASQQPDGFARAALKLADYRKLAPGALEEAVFFDHPSGRTRILTAMRWKAEHPETWAREAEPKALGPP